MIISFVVYGVAQPAGSKRGFAIRRGGVLTGRVAISDANPKSRSWKQEVSLEAAVTMKDSGATMFLHGVPIRANFWFKVPRPKGHLRKNGILKDWAMLAKPIVKPDLLKLARGIEDACSKICYPDDAQITSEHLYKRYCHPDEAPHVRVEFTEDAA
jgi:Holliday junction resolvase RusA-like endonuclease